MMKNQMKFNEKIKSKLKLKFDYFFSKKKLWMHF